MDRFSGWTRGTAIAALMVLSTGACAQRVAPPPQAVAPPPVAQAPVAPPPAPVAQPPAAPRAVVQAPAPKPPAATRPAPAPQVAQRPAPPPKTPAPPPIAETKAPEQLPETNVAAIPTPTPKPTRAPAPAPKVSPVAPKEPGQQYRVTEVVSDDYGSTVTPNPTPDSALDIAALAQPDTPPTRPSLAAPQTPKAPAFEPVAPQTAPPAPQSDAFAALTSLFGTSEPEPEPEQETIALVSPEPEPLPLPAPDPETVEEPAPAPETPLAANTIDPSENPYPGGFDSEGAYETAQLVQQPSFGYSTAQPAPAPSAPVAGFNPNAPITVAILTPDSDSRPSIRTLAKGLAQAAALSARTLGNRQLTLRGYDTGGTPEKAQVAARQAIADGAQLIIGPLFSSSAAAVAPVAEGAGVPVIAFTTDQSVLRRGIYSVGYLPDAEVERMLSYAAKRGITKIGLLSPDTPYGGIVYRNVQNAAPNYGMNVATVQPISPNFAEAAQTGERFASFYQSEPDTRGVLIATNGKPLQAIAAYLAYNDVLPSKVQYMGLGTWDDPETFREATLRGGWFPGIDPALKADFEGRYRNAYGSTPPAIAALAYDGIAIAGALIQRAQSTGQAPFTPANIETPTGFRGMSGLFRFLPDGRNQRLLSILKVGRRQFEMLDPAPTSFGQRLTSITGYAQ